MSVSTKLTRLTAVANRGTSFVRRKFDMTPLDQKEQMATITAGMNKGVP
ncbi:hypothetical protein ACWCQN_47120 [Streptomyces sp. NPDC001984]